MLKPTTRRSRCSTTSSASTPLAIEDTINYAQRPEGRELQPRRRRLHDRLLLHGVPRPDLETFRESLRTKELDLFVSSRYLVTSTTRR
jgi:hypothetical protein